VRGIGTDVHRDFCEIAVSENGRVRSAGRIPTRVGPLHALAQSLTEDDVVAIEATSGSDKIVSILQEHRIRVVVANTRKLKAITEAKAKTDRLDARTLARMLTAGLLDGVWTPTQVAKAGTRDLDWPFPARQSALFALEAEIHAGSLQALASPILAPKLRARPPQARNTDDEPRRVQIIDPQLIPKQAPAAITTNIRRSSIHEGSGRES
jgi:hypothetical protein